MEKLAAAVGKEPRTMRLRPDGRHPARILGIGPERPSRRRQAERPRRAVRDAAAVRNSAPCAARLLPPLRPDRGNPDGRCGPLVRRQRESGRTSRSGCSTTPASSAPAAMKKTGAGRRSSSHRPAGPALPESWMSGWRRSITLRPLRRRPQGSEQGARQGARDGQHPGRPVGEMRAKGKR